MERRDRMAAATRYRHACTPVFCAPGLHRTVLKHQSDMVRPRGGVGQSRTVHARAWSAEACLLPTTLCRRRMRCHRMRCRRSDTA
jgi:hypothetical protein